MYLNSILKGNFLCVKTFQPITTVINQDNKKLPIFQCSPDRITVVFRLRRDFVERKIIDQLTINKYTATGSRTKNNSKVVQQLAPFCIPCRLFYPSYMDRY